MNQELTDMVLGYLKRRSEVDKDWCAGLLVELINNEVSKSDDPQVPTTLIDSWITVSENLRSAQLSLALDNFRQAGLELRTTAENHDLFLKQLTGTIE